MHITLPEQALLVLIGVSGSGKSSFAKRHFSTTQILSLEHCRTLLGDDDNTPAAHTQAVELLHHIAQQRLQHARLSVIDADNLEPQARQSLIALAKKYHVPCVAIVLDMPQALCDQRNRNRSEHALCPHQLRTQRRQLKTSLKSLKTEGFSHITRLDSLEQVEAVQILYERLRCDRRDDHGPFDIIGDIHGCFDELRQLLATLGYHFLPAVDETNDELHYFTQAPAGRRVIFLGDLVDRGPQSNQVLRLVMDMVEDGHALCVPGNHEIKLLKKLQGKSVKLAHGLQQTLEQLKNESPWFIHRVRRFIDNRVSHYVLDEARLVVAHAGMPQELQGRTSGKVRSFALYGQSTGQIDAYGLPVRYNWAGDYRGHAKVIYGHTPVLQAQWINNTLCIDTGCVFGGQLTALRYPELEQVSVPAAQVYYEPTRPLHAPNPINTDTGAPNGTLNEEDIQGDHPIDTTMGRRILVHKTNALSALTHLRRFAVHPQWINYLPPTMSPCEAGEHDTQLEHPAAAFAYFRDHGVDEVICEEKHRGSRMIVQLCRDPHSAQQRFGAQDEAIGICYSRTGRRFFSDTELEKHLLLRLQQAAQKADLWNTLNSDWLTLDCELMPSACAQSEPTQPPASPINDASAPSEGDPPSDELMHAQARRLQCIDAYKTAYRHYRWPAHDVNALRLAPFHLLASEGQTHTDKDHLWHLHTLGALAQADAQLIVQTPHLHVDLHNTRSQEQAIEQWQSATDNGSEGWIIKPLGFISTGERGWLQPALKVRAHHHLRRLYGPKYDQPEHRESLRTRALESKRRVAMREFILGIEALQRFVDGAPLRQVHECVLGVLAMESEAMDLRL